MKITCCCFTCIVGEPEHENKEETSQLLQGEDDSEEQLAPLDKQPYSRSASGVSSASTLRGFSTESESFDGNGASGAKFSKAVGVLKKYNVMSSKYNTKELQRQLSTPTKLSLKIGIKIMPRSSMVKVSVIEAHGVTEVLQIKGLPDMTSSVDQEHAMVVQVRTKVIHSEVRGHTRKYEIQGGITGALKLRNETIHTVELEEFLHCKLRFRLYYVLKHQRDKLLGEYTLDVEGLNLDVNVAFTHTMLELYDPVLLESGPSIINSPPPEVTTITQRLASSDSQASTDKDVLSSTPKIQRQAKIRSQDSDVRLGVVQDTEKASSDEKSGDTSTTKKPLSKAFKSIRHSASLMLSKDSSKEKYSRSVSSETDIPPLSADQLTANEKLKMALRERGEKVEELEEATAAMADTAGNFSVLSLKLKEKYKAESKKKSKSADS